MGGGREHDQPEHIRVGVVGKLLREEIKLVLFHLLGGVHWVLSVTGGGWVYGCKEILYKKKSRKGERETKQEGRIW